MFLLPVISWGQVAINTTGAPPVTSSVLDISSTTMGFLLPRMSTAQMNAISSPATSLIVYNNSTDCYMFYTGTSWQNISCECNAAPTVPGSIIQSPSGTLVKGTAAVTYSVTNVAGVNYNWIVPLGYEITSGQGTNSIQVTIGCSSGTIDVTASNTCGVSSPSSIAVTVSSFSKTYSYTGSVQTLTVPPCVTTITVDMAGAQGGCAYSNNTASTYTSAINWGARLQTTVSVVTGAVISIYVGEAGSNGTSSAGGAGGTNGSSGPIYGSGGNGKTPTGTNEGTGGGGGASSEIWVSATRCLVASGGGGMGYSQYCYYESQINGYSVSCAYDGGAGGQSGINGEAYSTNYGNGAVYSNTPGAASNLLFTNSGYALAGAAGTNNAGDGLGGAGGQDEGDFSNINNEGGGGGGGGGYAGGGGGCGAGGGGGSSFSQGVAAFSPISPVYSCGYEGQNTKTPSNGYITISY